MNTLTPAIMAKAFGRRSQHARQIVGKLYDILRPDTPQYVAWAENQVIPALEALRLGPMAHQYGLRKTYSVPRLIYALQTYYAIVVKLLAAQSLELRPGKDLRQYFTNLENGSLFRNAGLENLDDSQIFDAYLAGWASILEEKLADIIEHLRHYHIPTHAGDILKLFYQDVLPRQFRHTLGEYFTPDWLADHVLDMLRYSGRRTLLDPACGTGTFLILAAARAARLMQVEEWLGQIAGFDINPLAILAARTNLLFMLKPHLSQFQSSIILPVWRMNALLAPTKEIGPYDIVAGNPPWINWEHLPLSMRQETRPLWEQYGLFSQTGMDTILGKGKKDLSLLFTYVSIDRYVRDQGTLAYIIPQGTFKSTGAGAGFRRFQLADGTPLRVLQVDDFSELDPFPDTHTRSAVIVLQKGQKTEYPVPYTSWRKQLRLNNNDRLKDVYMKTSRHYQVATPITQDDPASPWLSGTPSTLHALKRLVGSSAYKAHAGAYTGGANGVYWMEILDIPEPGLVRIRNIVEGARRAVPQVEAIIESDLLYPLLRSSDVVRWNARPSAYILMVQDPQSRQGYGPEWLSQHYPRVLAYLEQFENILRQRAVFRRYFQASSPFYSMFDIGEYTFSPVKVVWQGFGVHRMNAAVVTTSDNKPIIPNQALHPFISLDTEDEAHYLAACLNSPPFEHALISHTQPGGKSFAQPGILKRLYLPPYDATSSIHRQMVDISHRAHANEDIQDELGPTAARLWQLSEHEFEALQQSLLQLGYT